MKRALAVLYGASLVAWLLGYESQLMAFAVSMCALGVVVGIVGAFVWAASRLLDEWEGP